MGRLCPSTALSAGLPMEPRGRDPALRQHPEGLSSRQPPPLGEASPGADDPVGRLEDPRTQYRPRVLGRRRAATHHEPCECARRGRRERSSVRPRVRPSYREICAASCHGRLKGDPTPCRLRPATCPEVADYLDRATAVTKTLRQFKIPAYQVRQGDVRTLTDIFDRMNNYGKRLSRAEIFSALFAGDEGAKDDRLTIERIADDINTDLGFGLIDNDTVLRAILARRGPDVAREIRIEFDDQERRGPIEFPGEDRDTAYQAGEDALRRAVQFLQSKGGVPHLSMLAYRYLLIVLSRLFAHHPELDDRNLQLLRRWYWRAAVVGPGFFKGHILGATSSLCSKIKPNDLLSSIQGLLEAVDQKDAPIPSLNRFRTNEASTKITLCAWWHLEPRSPRSGQLYDRAQLSELLNGRTTAADAVRYIVSRRQVPKTYRLWAANRILIPTEDEPVDEIASLLVQRPLELAEESWASVLRSHGMDHEMTALLADGKVVDFLEARQAMLRDDLRRFLQRMCEWGFEDTPSLSELVVEDLDGEDLDIEGDDETR